MSSRLLPLEHRQRLWSPLPDLISDEGYRTLKPGSSQFSLQPEQIQDWPDFKKDIKSLLAPFCGPFHAFVPVVPEEHFGVANEIGVQGRFVSNALHPVGESASLLNLGVRFGDSHHGVNRVLVESKKEKKVEAKKEAKRKRAEMQAAPGSNLVPDLIVLDTKSHAIRGVGEVKTYWKFEPAKKQSWEQFMAQKIGRFDICSFS